MRGAIVASLVASATAAPWGGWGNWGSGWLTNDPRSNYNCMTYDDAQKVANNFKTLIASYSDDFAEQALTTDFHDYSDGVAELINGGCTTGGMATVRQRTDLPSAANNTPIRRITLTMYDLQLGDATFDSLKAFEVGQGGQPAIPFEILNVWNNCNTVSGRTIALSVRVT